ncbi:MAG: HTH-type transcriptional regulator CdhR [Rhodospirillales bacterium]
MPGISRPRRVAILLLPAHSQMVQMLLVELLRIAGLVRAEAFETINCSTDGLPVRASNGRKTEIDAAMTAVARPDAVVVCASYEPYRHLEPRAIAWLRQLARHGTLIGGIDTGSLLLAEAGLLDGQRAALHWDELDLARRRYPKVTFTGTLVERTPTRLTGCGSLGTVEFALDLIEVFQGAEVAEQVKDLTIHGRHEASFEQNDPDLKRALQAMTESLDRPLPLAAVATRAAVSSRQLTRLFDRRFGVSPGRYYLDLRLARAWDLATKTRFPLTEVALSTGFNSASWFSRAFKAKYGLSPSQARYGAGAGRA